MTSVAVPGPPLVSVWITMNVPNVDIVMESRASAAIGRRLGGVTEEREWETKAELPDHRGADDERDGVADHRPEIRIGEQPRVVIETNEARIRGVYADERQVREARIERPHRRTDEKEREEQGCRHDSGDVRGVPREHDQRIGRAPGRRRCASAPW